MSSQGVTSVGVLGTGSYVPTRVLTNGELNGRDRSGAAWVESNLGIRERRIAAPGQTTSDLAACAARRCLENADVNARDVDLLIVATATPDRQAPSTACIAQDKIGAVNAACFDLAAVCSGFVYAFVTGAQFVATGQCRHVLVVGADTFSRVTNWDDRSCVFFGDGAGAALLAPCPDRFGLLASELRADGSGKWNFTIPAGGSEAPASSATLSDGDHTWVMNGRAVFDTATTVVPEAVETVLARSGLSVADVDLLVPHQPSIRVLERIAERLGIDFDRVATNMHRYGNTAGASVGVVLDEANRSGQLADGAVVALAAVGSGWTWGAAVLRWPGRERMLSHTGRGAAAGFEPAPDTTGTALISLDPTGVVASWDAHAEQLLGHTADEAVGLRLETLCPGASSPRLRRAIAQAAAGRMVDDKGRLVTKDGGCVDVAMLLRPVRRAVGVVAVAVALVALIDGAQTDAYPWTLLTPREREIMALAGRGYTNDEIAELLVLSPLTVKTHLGSVYRKLGVSGRSAAAARLNPWPAAR